MLSIRRLIFPLCALALVGVATPASALLVNTIHIDICGGSTTSGFIACVTGSAANLETWWVSVGGTYCWSTGCDSYHAGYQPIAPLSVSYARYFVIPGNAFDACAYLEDGWGFVVASDCT